MLKSKIRKTYEKHNCSRICQGDILQDFYIYTVNDKREVIETFFPYIIIVSQDCDLEQGLNKKLIKEENGEKIFNQFLPNILILPAFPSEKLREGNHLIDLYTYKQTRISSDKWKIIKNNQNERYHFFCNNIDFQIPELVVDFKTYYTIDTISLLNNYKKKYLASVNELFREKLSRRFTNYTSRIGLPNI